MNKNLSEKHTKIQNAVFAAAMVAAAAFLFWKCRYGFANMDESLYLAIPYRFWQGDSMFVHEWNLSSFSSFLLLPFVYIYMFIAKTTEGMLLTFRYIFTAVQGITAVFIYFKLKRYNWLGAFAAALSFFMYAPFGIMALSYNSMGIQCMAVTTLLFMTNDKKSKSAYTVAGVLFAAAVLCCPYLVIVYVIYSLLVLVNVLRKGCFDLDILQKECWLWTTAGIAALAVLFLAFALSRASVKDIITALPLLLNDPYHGSSSFVSVVTGYIKGIIFCSDISVYLFAAYAVLLAAFILLRNRFDNSLFFCAAAVLTGLFMAPFVTWNLYINHTMFPVNILAFFCVLFTDSKVVKRLFKLVWIPGMMYGFCIHMASTEGFFNIASTSTVSLMASLVIVAVTGRELIEKSRINWLRLLTVCAVMAVMVMQTASVAYTRYVSVFWESGDFGGGMHTQTNTITTGPEKGLLVSDEKISIYNNFVEETIDLREVIKPESVLYITKNTWNYLVSEDVRTASFSAWLPAVDDITLERLVEYYGVNPDKIPQVIYAQEFYHDFAQKLAQHYGYTETKTQYGNYLYTK